VARVAVATAADVVDGVGAGSKSRSNLGRFAPSIQGMHPIELVPKLA
jgi:hypothetical protein